jgi:hypothetical protein
MKRIPVHRGELVFDALVDDEDHDFLAQHRWRASVRKCGTIYANASVLTPVGFKSIEMHRMVIGDFEEDWNLTLGGYPLEVHLENGKTSTSCRRNTVASEK